MRPSLRPARPADVPALAELVAASYRAAFGATIGPAGLARRDGAHFQDRLAREWPHVVVAEVPGGTAGGLLGLAEVRAGTLDMLFVRPGATSRGVGAALLAEAERRGAVRLECFARNLGALRFYERHGWRPARRYARPFAGAEQDFVALEKAGS